MDGKVYLATESGDLFCFKHEKTPKVIDELDIQGAADQKDFNAKLKAKRKVFEAAYLLGKAVVYSLVGGAAILLGEIFSKRWRVELSRNNLQRTRWTEPQVNLGAAERAANVRGAFAIVSGKELLGKRIFLVDDVYTTGSTAKECSRILMKAGAADVAVLTVARGGN